MYILIIFLLAIAFILNMICALGLKSLIQESDINWLKTKLIRILFLVPPISIVVVFVAWIYVAISSIVGEIKDYLD